MEKIFVVFDVEDQTLRMHIPTATVRAGTKGTYFAKILFDSVWQNVQDIRAGFFRDSVFHPLCLTQDGEDRTYVCEIPPQVIAEAGQFGMGLFAGSQLITNTEFVPVLPSFKNDIFNNSDFLDWFGATDQFIAALQEAIGAKSPIGHHHNDKYFTETEIDNILKSYVTSTVFQQTLSTHNAATDAHSDIRALISTITNRLNAVLDSDDITLDQLSEIVAYIRNNADLIAGITTNKADRIHTHDDRYFSQEAGSQLVKSLARVPVTVTETVNGSQMVLTCDQSLDQVKASGGSPYVRYMLDVGAASGASLICFAEKLSESANNIVFASTPDINGQTHIFTIDSSGTNHTVFTAMEHFYPAIRISEDNPDDIPNVWAVWKYAQPQNLIIDAVINYSQETIALDSSVTAEMFEEAYAAGKDVCLHATLSDAGMEGVMLTIPLTAAKTSYLYFSTVTDLSPQAAGNYNMIAVPVTRTSLATYGISIKKIKFEET
ncbi:MAG: hypothetical protein E7523_08300 [Ruminococcaceae bacterium]|nr:hypothetical protein [Oscillospiraceae bacterium]